AATTIFLGRPREKQAHAHAQFIDVGAARHIATKQSHIEVELGWRILTGIVAVISSVIFGARYQFLLLAHHHLSLDRSDQSSCAEVRSVRNSLRPVPAMFLTERANDAICLMGEGQLGGK